MAAVYIFYGYCFTGLLFALRFCFFKVTKVDEAAKGSSVWFKLIIVPATVLLWPVVWWKLYAKK